MTPAEWHATALELADAYANACEDSVNSRYLARGNTLDETAAARAALALHLLAYPVGVVWIVESGEYAQRQVNGLFATLEDAVESIRAPYVAPYIVQWDEPVKNERGDYTLTGHFTRVIGYCVDGPIEWDITPMPVKRNPKESS